MEDTDVFKQIEQWLLLSAFVVVGGWFAVDFVKSAMLETVSQIEADLVAIGE